MFDAWLCSPEIIQGIQKLWYFKNLNETKPLTSLVGGTWFFRHDLPTNSYSQLRFLSSCKELSGKVFTKIKVGADQLRHKLTHHGCLSVMFRLLKSRKETWTLYGTYNRTIYSCIILVLTSGWNPLRQMTSKPKHYTNNALHQRICSLHSSNEIYFCIEHLSRFTSVL